MSINLNTAKLSTFKVSMIDFYLIKSMFNCYIFNRKDENGYYIMADKEQQAHIKSARITLTEVTPENQ